MNQDTLKALLEATKSGETSIDEALEQLKTLPFSDLEFAVIDHHRQIRNGHPEVIYCESKTVDQVLGIMKHMVNERQQAVLATRVTIEQQNAIIQAFPTATINTLGRTAKINCPEIKENGDYVAIVAAGTSDLPVVEEAYETVSALGHRAVKIVDVGVAGIHRLFSRLDLIRGAKVVIVVAGMEGALASVVGGLVDKPVIAVPTSVGYGASFGGISALLTMLNSCSSGVTVVNIDNGFGAAYAAAQIMKL